MLYRISVLVLSEQKDSNKLLQFYKQCFISSLIPRIFCEHSFVTNSVESVSSVFRNTSILFTDFYSFIDLAELNDSQQC